MGRELVGNREEKSRERETQKFKFLREIWRKIHISQEDLFKVKAPNRGGGVGAILELFSEAPELSELTRVFLHKMDEFTPVK